MARLEHTSPVVNAGPPRGSLEEQIAVLQMTKDVMSMMDDESLLMSKVSEPVLWHTDLHMGNIYVSHENPVEIVSIIDWQSSVASPMFIQARLPEFLPAGDDFTLGTTELPQLPQNFDEMDAEDQKYAEYKLLEAKLAKGYELACGVENNQAYKAFGIPSFVRELFVRCGEVSEEGVIPLRACLIEMSKMWHDLRFTAPCPIRFSEDDLQRHEEQFDAYRNFHALHEFARNILSTDFEGWVAPQFDFEAKKQRNHDLMQEFMSRSAEFNMSPEDVQRTWPYRERP
jgi:hypothetical protein